MQSQATRINKVNDLIVTSMVSRSQHRNYQDAYEKLQYCVVVSLIEPYSNSRRHRSFVDDAYIVPKERIMTEKPKYAKERRLRDKRIKSTKKVWRKKPSDDG